MKRAITIFCFLLIWGMLLSADQYSELDGMIDNGKHIEALNLMKSRINEAELDTALLWRIGWAYYEQVDNSRSKSQKVTSADEALNYLKPYLNLSRGDKQERAKIIFWYAVIYSLRGQAKGIFDSLGSLPEIISLCKKSIALYPQFGSPYHLMGLIGEAVPIGEYSNKFIMGENYSLAIKYDPENITILVDSGRSIMKRDWDVNKKKSQNSKYKRTDGTPVSLSDKQYAKELLEKAVRLFETRGQMLTIDVDKYKEAKELLKKL